MSWVYVNHEMTNQTDPKGWIQGNTKIGPVLEVTTSYLQGKNGVEIRIGPVNKDNSHSCVRISHGLNKDFIDKEYDDNEQETSTTKTEVFAFANRSQAKAKPRRPSTICSSSRTMPILERTWIDIEPAAQFDQAYPVAKRINTLLRASSTGVFFRLRPKKISQRFVRLRPRSSSPSSLSSHPPWWAKNNIVTVLCDAFTQTRLMSTLGVSAGLPSKHRRPKACERWEFRFLGV